MTALRPFLKTGLSLGEELVFRRGKGLWASNKGERGATDQGRGRMLRTVKMSWDKKYWFSIFPGADPAFGSFEFKILTLKQKNKTENEIKSSPCTVICYPGWTLLVEEGCKYHFLFPAHLRGCSLISRLLMPSRGVWATLLVPITFSTGLS